MVTYMKTDMVKTIAAANNIPEKKVNIVISAALDYIKDKVQEGNRVTLKEFGRFERRIRPAYIGIIPGKSDPVKIPSYSVLGFKSACNYTKNTLKIMENYSDERQF